jgi:hypothetical protein
VLLRPKFRFLSLFGHLNNNKYFYLSIFPLGTITQPTLIATTFLAQSSKEEESLMESRLFI